jgi:hypothetical protein
MQGGMGGYGAATAEWKARKAVSSLRFATAVQGTSSVGLRREPKRHAARFLRPLRGHPLARPRPPLPREHRRHPGRNSALHPEAAGLGPVLRLLRRPRPAPCRLAETRLRAPRPLQPAPRLAQTGFWRLSSGCAQATDSMQDATLTGFMDDQNWSLLQNRELGIKSLMKAAFGSPYTRLT